jgi:hypothetical protein
MNGEELKTGVVVRLVPLAGQTYFLKSSNWCLRIEGEYRDQIVRFWKPDVLAALTDNVVRCPTDAA